MMAVKEKTVRIGPEAHRTLRALAVQTGDSMLSILDKAIEEYRRKRFLEKADAAYAALRSDSEVWREEQEERTAWEATLVDGQEDA